MSDEIAIRVNNLGKCYHIYDRHSDRLKQLFSKGGKKYYREFWALQDISFEIKKGEAFGVIGKNGAGKSTLLQLICKTLTPTTGSVETQGKIAALLELGSGFNPEFTGRENVYINGAILGFSRQEIDDRFDEIVAFADIGDFIDQPVKTYSSGMYVRLAFAVQVCVEPDILVVDEALAVGDIFFRQKCYQRLNLLREKGVSIVLVSHGMNEVEQFCQRALFLQQGKKFYLGPADEAVRYYYLAKHDNQNLSEEDSAVSCVFGEKESDKEIDKTFFAWPDTSAFLDLMNISQISNNYVKCTGVAVCDRDMRACCSFQQGDVVSFFYEFEALKDVSVPLVGILILNDKGIIVHGKGTLEYGTQIPMVIGRGNKWRIRQDVCLEIAIGEYSFEVGLGKLNMKDYEKRHCYSYEDLYSKVQHLFHLNKAGYFAVLPRIKTKPVQLLHHGIANLSGSCNVMLLSNK